uniref:Uncharacterized protein n=1 Tax=Salix viminalis TaxID=40686 RepID=A0A6N2LEX6_SALVM
MSGHVSRSNKRITRPPFIPCHLSHVTVVIYFISFFSLTFCRSKHPIISSLYFQLPLPLSFSVISSLLEGKVETSSISVNKKGKAM